jgi:hypothetical protein
MYRTIGERVAPSWRRHFTQRSHATNRRDQPQNSFAPRPQRGHGCPGNHQQQRHPIQQADRGGLYSEGRGRTDHGYQLGGDLRVRCRQKRLASHEEHVRHRLPVFETVGLTGRISRADELLGLASAGSDVTECADPDGNRSRSWRRALSFELPHTAEPTTRSHRRWRAWGSHRQTIASRVSRTRRAWRCRR